MPIIALDFGRRRIGVAISADELTAHPLAFIERRTLAHDLASLRLKVAPYRVSRVIVGLPLNMDGSEGPQARAARAFAQSVRDKLDLPVELFDERLTSFEAEQRLAGLKVKRSKRKGAVDALAAAIILESWLQRQTVRDST